MNRCIFIFVVFVAVSVLVSPAGAQVHYKSVLMDGEKIGYAIHSRTVQDGIVTTTDTVKITMTRAAVPVMIETFEKCVERLDGKPVSFESVQNISMMQTRIRGAVKPDGMVDVVIESGLGEEKKQIKWPEGAVMAEGLRLIQEKHGLAEGTKYKVKVFSPSMFKALDAEIEIGPKKDVDLLGRVLKLTEVTTKMNMFPAGQIISTSYVNDELEDMKTVTSTMGIPMEIIECEKDFALAETGAFDMLERVALDSPSKIEDIDEVKSITYWLVITGDVNDFEIPSTDNQNVRRVSEREVIVTVEPVRIDNGGELPYRGEDKEALDALKTNRFVQSDDELIVSLAQIAIDDAKDAMTAAKKIEQFAADYIQQKTLSVGYASAGEVARSKQGDCSEHSVFTAALCRAVGIPAKVAVGLAYVADEDGPGRFGPHAWTEVYISGKWVGLDSTFKAHGRGFDAGHIELDSGSGEPSDFAKVLFNLGRFKIAKIEIIR